MPSRLLLVRKRCTPFKLVVWIRSTPSILHRALSTVNSCTPFGHRSDPYRKRIQIQVMANYFVCVHYTLVLSTWTRAELTQVPTCISTWHIDIGRQSATQKHKPFSQSKTSHHFHNHNLIMSHIIVNHFDSLITRLWYETYAVPAADEKGS